MSKYLIRVKHFELLTSRSYFPKQFFVTLQMGRSRRVRSRVDYLEKNLCSQDGGPENQKPELESNTVIYSNVEYVKNSFVTE